MNESVIAIIVNRLNLHLSSANVIGRPAAHIVCRDGTRLSVQAGTWCYCRPNNNQGPWTHVEVMVMTDAETKYITTIPSDVSGYVPIEDVAREILHRGNWPLT